MRNIKFRVWSKLHKKWYTNTILIAYDGLPFAHFVKVDDDGKAVEHQVFNAENLDLVVQQSTGLTDQNGQEIYEGDLLWRPTVNRTIYLVDFNDENYGWLMGWNLLDYGIIDDKNNLLEFDKVQWSNNTDVVNYPVKSYYYGSSPNDHYEVVGNIFEGVDK